MNELERRARRTTSRHTRAALVLALASLTSCGGSSSTTPVGDPAAIELSDDDVTFSSLQATADLDAVVRDAGGTVIAATVTWTTDASSVASVTNQGVVTAVANGDTRVIATAGPVADTATITVQQVAATLSLSPDTLRLAAVDDTASVVPTVRDAGGSTMSGVAVTFASQDAGIATVNVSTGRVTAKGNGATLIVAQVAPGTPNLTENVRVEVGGSLAPAYLVGGYVNTAYSSQIPAASGGGTFSYIVSAGALPTGLNLNASTRAITGTPITSGVHFFEVTATNTVLTVSQRYAITISTMPSAAFNLWVAYNGGPMPPVNAQVALTNALDRWEEIITEDAGASVTYSSNAFPTAGCSALVDGTLYNGAFIEDVAFILSIAAIDGPSNTLAQAGPCGSSRPQVPVIVSGQMMIDQADASGSATFLRDVIIHEIGHVLGIGTFWQDSTVFVNTDSVSYFGQNGKAQWIALGGSGNVPLEPKVGAHWRESTFGNEIMTPSAEGPGSAHPISRLTIGALLDLGWTTSIAVADFYELPGCSPACTVPARAPGERVPIDVVIEPLTPLPPGSLGN